MCISRHALNIGHVPTCCIFRYRHRHSCRGTPQLYLRARTSSTASL
jgi:hypothetical protein